jgi:hypothetical protein
MAFISLKVSSTLEMQVTLVGQESSPLQENQVSSERVSLQRKDHKMQRSSSTLGTLALG